MEVYIWSDKFLALPADIKALIIKEAKKRQRQIYKTGNKRAEIKMTGRKDAGCSQQPFGKIANFVVNSCLSFARNIILLENKRF
jgi:hypothetical protein